MKDIFKLWNRYLKEDTLSDYEQGDRLTLYHYSRADSDRLILDPEHFLSGRNSFSKREYEKSQVPRTFFYLDPAQAEPIVKSGRNLYTVSGNPSDIYDLKSDPEGIITSSRQPGAFFVDYNKVFNTIKREYKGAYYGTPSFDVVAWFESIQSTKEI